MKKDLTLYLKERVMVEMRNGNIVIPCSGGCGKTSDEVSFIDFWKGRVEQVDESGIPEWTCEDCLNEEKGGD